MSDFEQQATIFSKCFGEFIQMALTTLSREFSWFIFVQLVQTFAVEWIEHPSGSINMFLP